MARRKMDIYVKGPRAEEAKALARKVFKLKDKLGISYEQMAKESGLDVKKLYYLNSAWVKGTKDFEYMYPTAANALIEFWNKHLINGEKAVEVKVAKKVKTPVLADEPAQDVLAILVVKVGLSQARKLLKARKKEDKLNEFLQNLSPEKLADLV